MRSAVLAFALLALGCDEAHDETEPPAACPEGSIQRPEGGCLQLGVQANGCAAGELLVGDTCVTAGASTLCGEGFAPDDRGGCIAALPPAPCPFGSMAIMGESACRAVAECGSGRWGNIPVEPSTVYVDARYVGADADGTPDRPFSTIQQGIDAATPGAIVAVTDGSYVEAVQIVEPVRLWGRCPERVAVVGGDPTILVGLADGIEIRGLTVRDGNRALGVVGSWGVRIEDVWVHDVAGGGILANDQFGATELLVRNVLVERVGLGGIVASGAQITVERSSVRDVTPTVPSSGVGMFAQRSPMGVRGSLTTRASIVERSQVTSIGALGGDLTVEDSLIRDGGGCEVNAAPDTGEPSWLMARSTVASPRCLMSTAGRTSR